MMGFLADAWKGLSETFGGVTRTNLGNVVGGVFTGNFSDAEREYEKGIVRSVASSLKSQRSGLERKIDNRMNEGLRTVADRVKTIGNSIDDSIEGQFSEAVKNEMGEKASELKSLTFYEETYLEKGLKNLPYSGMRS